MDLEERLYSVLTVSAAGSFNAALHELLPESAYHPVRTVSSVHAAKRTAAERAFDFLIVNSPLPDDAGIRFCVDSCASGGTAVLLLVKREIQDEVFERVVRHGVFLLPKPTTKAVMTAALGWMASARERLRRFEGQSLSVEERMAEIRLVNRAKWVLISELKMSEPDAHRYIEKRAMDGCVSKREIAEEIIRTYS